MTYEVEYDERGEIDVIVVTVALGGGLNPYRITIRRNNPIFATIEHDVYAALTIQATQGRLTLVRPKDPK